MDEIEEKWSVIKVKKWNITNTGKCLCVKGYVFNILRGKLTCDDMSTAN
jgi:hypothetical protein